MSRATIFRKLEALYRDMGTAFQEVADQMGHTCDDCQRNCCVSHFEHHTYVEWAFFWKGLKALPEAERGEIIRKAAENTRQAKAMLDMGAAPLLMCPVNVDGRCSLYSHRLMICRLHGIPNTVFDPRVGMRKFPGCWRSVELIKEKGWDEPPVLDRTPFYVRLAALEREFLGNKFGKLPKVDRTLATLILAGEPRL